MPPSRATTWQLRTKRLTFGAQPLLMGIVNVTPDSFSDGGQYLGCEAAMEHGLKLLDEGAAILDIGGESTRPYSTPVDEHEELKRVLPVVEGIHRARPEAILSIDTSKVAIARAAIAAGAEIINDVTGLTGDPEMIAFARDSQAGVCAMHMQGTPQTMQDNPTYTDIVAEIHDYLRQRRDTLLAAGIDRNRICLDPGIGFGKTQEHNVTLMASCHRFHDLGQPLLVGHSRKGFIGKLLGDKDAPRLFGTLGSALALAAQGVQVIRVHDVRPLREALSLFAACGGLR
ncbi:MAG: dihydropteroate synthase [Pirellulaceae bacterium]